MQYQVFITFLNDKSVNVLIPESQVDEVMEMVQGSTDVFLHNEKTNISAWFNRDEIRHILIQPVSDEPKKEEDEEISEEEPAEDE